MNFAEPEKIIEVLDIIPGLSAVDFGCGAGFYTIALARACGSQGKVYALDIRKEMLEMVRSKARTFRLTNIETFWTDLEKPHASNLKDQSMDIAIISNVLFQIENKENLASEAARILKPAGKLLLVEWAEEERPIGPPIKFRINRNEAESLFLKANLILDREISAGEHHYGLLFKKSVH